MATREASEERRRRRPRSTGAASPSIKGQALVAFYDGAQVAQDNEMYPSDWTVSTLLSAPIRHYSVFETLWQDNGKLLNECNHAPERVDSTFRWRTMTRAHYALSSKTYPRST